MNHETEHIDERPVIAFEDTRAWRAWLEQNYESTPGVWVKIAKKASGIQTVTYQEALEEALCFGWIDGLKRPYDERYFIQKFTPRTRRSMWSKRNQGIVERLVAEGRMQPAGQREIDVAKADGRWERAYGSSKTIEIPEDFLQELAKDKKAEAFFKTLNKANTFAIAFRLTTAKKPETRARRMQKILEMLANEEKFY